VAKAPIELVERWTAGGGSPPGRCVNVRRGR